MYTIICDSATSTLYMALLKDNLVLTEKYYNDLKGHSEHIVSGIYQMLEENKVQALDIDKFICGIGPGSYTGVRMAVTVAKMFGAFTKAKIYQISTLCLMSSGSSGKTLTYIDARNGNVFGAIYENGNVIINDSFVEYDQIAKNNYDNVVKNGEFRVNPKIVIEKASLVVEPDLLIPNYLRDTEAERNLHA